MTEEEKSLLLKDLCERLPYEVKIYHKGLIRPLFSVSPTQFYQIILDNAIDGNHNGLELINLDTDVVEIKPYLRLMSSMMEEEKEDLKKNYHFYFDGCSDGITNGIYSSQFNRTIYEMIDEYDISDIIDWLNAHHFDYRGLIQKGLALEAPEGMYETL